jgi:ECF sigma factor
VGTPYPQNGSHDVSRLLRAWSEGDRLALGELIPIVYAELRRLAHRYMRGERPGHSLQTTAMGLKVSPVTVRRDWNSAKIWLYRELTGETDDGFGSLETAR